MGKIVQRVVEITGTDMEMLEVGWEGIKWLVKVGCYLEEKMGE